MLYLAKQGMQTFPSPSLFKIRFIGELYLQFFVRCVEKLSICNAYSAICYLLLAI